MGMAPGPFLWCWTLMMAAMMWPSLIPLVAARYQHMQVVRGLWSTLLAIFIFAGGYLSIWSLLGLPAFGLAWLAGWLALNAPVGGQVMGLGCLLLAGIYQMTPLASQALVRCHPSHCCTPPPSRALANAWRDGLAHGMACLTCCGGLMLVMVAVGLMNIPWMALLTLLIFLEKTWTQGTQGSRLSFFIGFWLLIFAVMACAEPSLLGGCYLAR
jgi:predicted metal-binding membrane protein